MPVSTSARRPGWLAKSPRPAEHTAGQTAGRFDCRQLSLTYRDRSGRGVEVIAPLDLTIEPGQFVSLLGGSGVGKTSLLRVLGGLQAPDDGSHVHYDSQPVDGPPAGVVTVFQDYASSLLPWRTVRENIALGIEGECDREERAARVRDALEMINLTASADAHPWQISGGMQQRVQIARALVTRPTALMMDEPFGALDAMTKASLQDSLLRIHAETRTTVVFVTHDIDEAVYLSDRVIVLAGSPGSIALDCPVGLPRPRGQVSTKEDPEYLRIRHLVHDTIRSGHDTEH
jgi:ABC-type nitrate/sulfonate/bicarbonate transport system ATPase subunit